MPDIIDTAINAGTFNTLVTAITTAGLDTALKGSGPFTVFAPTDEAFSKLPSGTVEALLEDVLELRKVLEYHVVAQKIVAVDLAQ
ncbi:MAG: fasciclin domain-containing protein, partial [Nostoc sp.]